MATTTRNGNSLLLLGYGTITIHFQYTCGIGKLARPHKNTWPSNGAMRRTHILHNVTLLPPSMLSSSSSSSLIRTFQMQSPRERYSLSKFKKVYVFGDSILQNLHSLYWDRVRFRKKNTVVSRVKPASELTTETVQENFLETLERQFGPRLRASQSAADTVLVTNSAVWDLLEPIDNDKSDADFGKHIQGLELYLKMLVERYPNVTVYWTLPTAIQVHVLGEGCYKDIRCIDRTRYMSTSLIQRLYDKQRELTRKLNVTVIDVFEATYVSARWLMDGDGRHYNRWFNSFLQDWYYPRMEKNFFFE